MKPQGLLAVLGKGLPSKGGAPIPKAEEPIEETEETEGGDSKEYASLVISALKDGDDEGAAEALESLVRACK